MAATEVNRQASVSCSSSNNMYLDPKVTARPIQLEQHAMLVYAVLRVYPAEEERPCIQVEGASKIVV